jgi:hypothetical protein
MHAVLAAAARLDRDYLRDKTVEGQQAAAAKGRHGGRPKVIDDDMLIFALALRAGRAHAGDRRGMECVTFIKWPPGRFPESMREGKHIPKSDGHYHRAPCRQSQTSSPDTSTGIDTGRM